MNWQHFQTYNEASTRAFESMCNQLFELWCKKTFHDSLISVVVVNGSGGDGGVESFATKNDGTVIGLQAKWFLNSISANQFDQIESSIETALRVRPLIKQYIVCVPRDLASDRIGKGKKLIENTEFNRWQHIKDKIEAVHPGLIIELWNDTRLLTELQFSGAAGIYRYWFEKSEISRALFTYSYEKQKSGWLSQKYTPALHIQGEMQKNILKFAGTLADRQSSINKLKHKRCHCIELLKACRDYLEFTQNRSHFENLIDEIKKTQNQVNQLLNDIDFAIAIVHNEQKTPSIKERNWHVDFSGLLELLKENRYSRESYFHIKEIAEATEKIQSCDFHSTISDICFQLNNNKYLILGNPGSGKTHGIAGIIESLLCDEFHIPLLIHAKEINPQNNWLDIIKNSLGLASDWNETELWQALEALSYRTEINRISIDGTFETKIIPKIIIFVEGVDESQPYDLWYDRLREVEAICSKYPRLRFCITSRPYVFRELNYDDRLLSNALWLAPDGDVPVNELYEEYIRYFQVNIDGGAWIKWSLKTPLALRVFCEIYKYQRVSALEKSALTITKLISHKFQIIEREFNVKYGTGYGDKEYIVQNSLLVLAGNFLNDASVPRNDLIESLKDVSGLVSQGQDYRRMLIDFIEDYGILQSYTVNSKNLFEPSKTVYSIGIQPFFDYILALLITNQIRNPAEITFTKTLIDHEGALQMVAIILLEDFNYLISENVNFRDNLRNNQLFDLVCFSLSSVSPGATIKHIPLVTKMIAHNSDTFKSVVNKIILPVSRIENHPLGAQFLHEILMSYETAGKRDLIWSVPCYLRYRGESIWKCYTEVDLSNSRYKLCNDDKYNGIPLVYAWMLTTVNNVARVDYRRELMKWALAQPSEYFKLFEHTNITNDLQMQEDLFAIAMGTVYMIEKGNPCLKAFGDWVISNVFAPDKICTIYSCAIRYYSRAIVERCYAFDEISEEDVEKSRPPYNTKGAIYLQCEATSGTRMGGFGPIDYDLSRYVLCDPIDRMFFENYNSHNTTDEDDYACYFSEKEINKIMTEEEIVLKENCILKLNEIQLNHRERRQSWDNIKFMIVAEEDEELGEKITTINPESPTDMYDEETDRFLSDHARILDMESLEPNQFVLSAAYAYILKQGWNNEEFYGHPNGDKPGEVIGADIAIMRQYHPATHGSKSNIMTFCEKYTWCARNTILGYLSDRLPFKDFERPAAFLNDYGLLDDFPNPVQELYQDDPDRIMERTSWFVPEDLSPLLNESSIEVDIRDWIINAPPPDFEKWIVIKDFDHEIIHEKGTNEWVSLYSYNSISNALGGESIMWISSGLIPNAQFKYLQNDLINQKEFVVRALDNPEDMHATTETQCYITPKEICWMNWKNECYGKIPVISIDTNTGEFCNYAIEKVVEKCTANYPEYGDVYYKMPSRIMREMLGICDGDGYKYYNSEKQLEAFYFEAGKKWYDSQSFLCVDGKKLPELLEHLNYKIFWIVRLLREATPKAREKYPNLYSQNDKSWMVWFEDGVLKSILFSDRTN